MLEPLAERAHELGPNARHRERIGNGVECRDRVRCYPAEQLVGLAASPKPSESECGARTDPKRARRIIAPFQLREQPDIDARFELRRIVEGQREFDAHERFNSAGIEFARRTNARQPRFCSLETTGGSFEQSEGERQLIERRCAFRRTTRSGFQGGPCKRKFSARQGLQCELHVGIMGEVRRIQLLIQCKSTVGIGAPCDVVAVRAGGDR